MTTIGRRSFFATAGGGLAGAALAQLVRGDAGANTGMAPGFAPKAKRVIYLFQSGAPSQMDLFDHKPGLENLREIAEAARKQGAVPEVAEAFRKARAAGS